MGENRGLCFVLVFLGVVALCAGSASADPVNEARMLERSVHYGTPQFQEQVLRAGLTAAAERARVLRADPGRHPDPDACTVAVACVGDPRLSDGNQISAPVAFTARSGATLSGHVWASRSGPSKRPLVVIVNGSIVGFEQSYWPQAQVLAKSGYVVLTFDAQGEGLSDQFGERPDQSEGAGGGTPGLPDNGSPFYDGAEDALDFALSTPSDPYSPVPSRSSHTSHAEKQRTRAAAGFDAAYNPLWALVNPAEVGLAGHSYGAVAASYVAQDDPRVRAVVAWDSLCVPVQPAPDEVTGLFLQDQAEILPGVSLPLAPRIPRDCFGAPGGQAPRLTKPALGISADYVLPGFPRDPDPEGKSTASQAYSAAGVDTGQLIIQGGTHADFAFDASVPVLPATLRGLDLVAWYTTAWFDKYLTHDPSADDRLRTRRWQADQATAAADPVHDGNAFSNLYRSRMDIHLADGARWTCEGLRAGCSGMSAEDGRPADYSYLAVATGP
ncbi:hypothetical protein FPZ12_010855 [Amycolatopsis acidicola]|uniref:Alpha/beta hydrolase n=1 Tax=Amycolatopsis acidicola TaxID=2596893 RepID=A0A5N0V879_9PSEU|nr:hypothetical protein [Amycolatopsis acidicola]KAA9162557.1 hypothetical protein FPZ12_010855 [Amycolatopsis acidicola]